MHHLINDAINKYKFNKIFLITDQAKYLKLFQKKYGNIYHRKESLGQTKAKYLI